MLSSGGRSRPALTLTPDMLVLIAERLRALAEPARLQLRKR
jgi:hypothetical protein